MRRAKLIMNMTSMLDILIILFFAQAIEYKDKAVQKITTCEKNADDLQKKCDGLEVQVTDLEKHIKDIEEDKEKLSKNNEKLKESNENLSNDNDRLNIDLSQKLAELADKTKQYNNELDNKDKELKKIKDDIHLVDENLDTLKILEKIQIDNKDISKDKATDKVIEFIETQRDIQKQTEKKVAIWIITLDNFYDKRDNKDHLVMRLFISGKEKTKFKELSDKPSWNWGDSNEIHPEDLKKQLLDAFNRIDIISDSDIQLVNIVLCFKDKKDTILTPQIQVFYNIFEDLFYQLEKTYSQAASVNNPKGRGKGVIRLMPIPFDPDELSPLDPELLIK